MNELKVFENSEFGSIRTVNIDNEPYFVGKDVAQVLGYSNTRKAIADHVDDEDKKDGVTIRDTIGRNQSTVAINESGLYSLILSSKLPSAKRFKRWVTSEVLPSVRQTGAYMTPETIERVLCNPDTVINLAQQLKNLQLEVARKNQLIGELQPKANYVDIILDNKGLVTITQIAKDYGMSGAAMNKLLNRFGVQFKQSGQWLLYSRYHDLGYTHSKTINITRSDGRSDVVLETKWTQKGRLFIYELLKDNEILPVIEQGTNIAS
jgi:prophage antirepressor-like protein